MSTGPRYKVPFRRRRTNQTDYRKRRKMLLGNKTRLVVRRSLRKVSVQLVNYGEGGDRIVSSALSTELKEFGWTGSTRNVSVAYLAGFLAAKRAMKAGVELAVLDLGLYEPTKGSIPFAVVKGAIDAGLEVPVDEEILPSEDRISGKHLGEGVPAMFGKVKSALEKEG